MIKVDTKYTIETYRELLWFSLFRNIIIKVLYFVVVPLLFLISVGIYLFWIDDIELLYVALVLATVFVTLLVFISVYPKRVFKNSPAIFKAGVLFEIDDTQITITQTGDIVKSNDQLQFEAFYKIYEAKKAFYLFISPNQAYILSKNDFTIGTPDDLRELFSTKFSKKKFIIHKL